MAGTPLREVFVRFGVTFDDTQLRRGDAAAQRTTGTLQRLGLTADGIKSALGSIGVSLSAAFAIREVYQFARAFATTADEIDKTSQRLGVSTRALQAWRHAASLSGVPTEQLNGAMRSLQRNAAAVARGSQEQARAFRLLGVNVRGADGQLRSTTDLLLDVGDALSRMTDTTRRGGVAMQIFGDAGTSLLPVFAQGRAGAEAMLREFEELGGGIGEDAIRASTQMNDDFQRLSITTSALQSRIALHLIPALDWLVNGMRRVSLWFNEVSSHTRLVEALLIGLGATAVLIAAATISAWAPIVVPLLAIVAAVGLVILIFEDLYATIAGEDSVTRRFLDWLIGAENAEAAIARLRATLAQVAGFFGISAGAEGSLTEAANRAGAAQRNSLVSLITGRQFAETETLTVAQQQERKRRIAAREAPTVPAPPGAPVPSVPSPVLRPRAGVGAGGRQQTINVTNSPVINTSTAATNPRAVAEQIQRTLDQSQQALLRQLRAAAEHAPAGGGGEQT